MMTNRYGLFLAMIATSIIAMFVTTYLNSWEFGHVFWSETRAYMVLYMGAVMALIMLAYMLGMYTNKTANLSIIVGAVALFGVALWLVRSQTTVEDTSWMRAMIPHHSIAILTSERANISDTRVRKLADEIIKAQKLEIDEMKALIAELEGGPKATPEIDGKVAILIITQYVAMLTAFFFLASMHALHQVAFLSDCYARKSGRRASQLARLIDYGVVFSALYPWTVYKMMLGRFYVGPVQLWSPFNPGQLLHGQWWMVGAVFIAFFALLVAFVVKSLREWQDGTLNVPKTLLILVTLPVMHLSPLVDNLDTAFQGINIWHSLQYLAITWFVIRRAEARNERQPYSLFQQFRASFAAVINWGRAKLMGHGTPITPEQSTLMWTAAFYTFQVLMLPISGIVLLFALIFFPNLPYAEQYSYLMVLPILLVHYYHDAFLFTQSDALVD